MTKIQLVFTTALSNTLIEGGIFVAWRWLLPALGIRLPLWVLIVVMLAFVVLAVVNFRLALRMIRRKAVVGMTSMIGSRGKVTSALSPEGMVRIRGELWRASTDEGRVEKGEEVVVVGQEGLKLIVHRSRDEA